jgi:hypothetical protein
MLGIVVAYDLIPAEAAVHMGVLLNMGLLALIGIFRTWFTDKSEKGKT